MKDTCKIHISVVSHSFLQKECHLLLFYPYVRLEQSAIERTLRILRSTRMGVVVVVPRR